MGIIPNVKSAIAMLFTDTMDVQRYVNGKDADGNTISLLDTVPALSGIPCRLSYTSKDSPMLTQDGNPIDIQPELICSPDTPLNSGDFVTVKRNGTVVYSGNIGLPNAYQNSMQVLFRNKGVS